MNHSDMINVIQIKVFIVITDKPMSTQLSKMPSKAALQKPKSTLSGTFNKEKKIHSQTLLNSSLVQNKKKRHQPNTAHNLSNIEKYQSQSSIHSKNTQETKAGNLYIGKDSTVSIEEQGLPVSKKVKNPEDKGKPLATKTKYMQQSKQNLHQRDITKPLRAKIQEKQKQFTEHEKPQCSIRSNVFSVQLFGDIIKMQKNHTDQLQYQEMVKKLNETIQENKQLKSKLDKLKITNQESRKQLKDQVANFNLEGEEAKKNKQTLEQLQIQNRQLGEEINRIIQENVAYSEKIGAQRAQKRELQAQNQLQHKTLCQMKEKYNALQQQYQEQAKILQEKQQQIKELISCKSQAASSQLQSKLYQSSAYFDQVTDLSINSQLRDDSSHSFKPILVQALQQDVDIIEMVRQAVQKYVNLINELKGRIFTCEMQNFQLQAEIQKLRQNNNNFESEKIDLNTQTKILQLLHENSRLKMSEYETKQEIKQITEKLTLLELQNKQLVLEKEVQKEQLTVLQSQIAQLKLEEQALRQEQNSLKQQLEQSQQLVRTLKMEKQQDSLSKAPSVKKIKFFK